MKFKDIKKELGNGRLLTIEASPYCTIPDNCPSVLVRNYEPGIDYSDTHLFEYNGFVQDAKDSIMVRAIKEALGVDKVFAFADYTSDIDEINGSDNVAVVWKNLMSFKNGNLAECCCNYIVSVKKDFKLGDIDYKVFNGIKFYCL